MSEQNVDYAEKNRKLLEELLRESRKMAMIIRNENRINRTNNG